MAIQFSPARPSEENNGLEPLHDLLMKPTAEPIVAVVIIDRTKRVFGDSDSEDADYPVVRFTRVEPMLEGAARDAALELLNAAYDARGGKAALDLPVVDDEPAPADEVAAKRSRKPKAAE
jgi:hypothetical protein